MKIKINITFEGEMDVLANNVGEARNIIENNFGVLLGSVQSIDDRIRDWDIDKHGTTIIKTKEPYNGQMTLARLYDACRLEMASGNGDKLLVIPDDNEGNGYHGMFFGISHCEEDTATLIYDSKEKNPKNLLIVG